MPNVVEPPPPLLTLYRLGFAYAPASPPVLDDISARVHPGRLLTILGPNAAGKTTLLRLMLGQLQPTAGHVHLDNQPAHSLPPRQLARRIGYVPQRPGGGHAFTVRQTVAMGRWAHRDAAAPTGRNAITRALDECDLTDLADRPLHQLSGGQQQRVLIARAITQVAPTSHHSPKPTASAVGGPPHPSPGATAPTPPNEADAEAQPKRLVPPTPPTPPRGILMDEPVGHLDPKHADRIMQLGRSLADQGLAVVMVLHELNLAAAWADDAWLLHQGRLAAAGPWPDVIHPDTLSPVYDVPLHTVAHHPTGRPILTTRPAHCPV